METHENAPLPPELAVVSLVASPDAAARYAELTADFNPIHLDAGFAARTSFGRPIAHGTMALNLVVESLERTFGVLPRGVHIEVRFVAPVPVGSTIRAGGHLTDQGAGTYEIFVETQAGERAVQGTCTLGARAGQHTGANAP